MKLSVENYGLSERFGEYKAAEIIKDAGFDAFDCSYYGNRENEKILGDEYREFAENLRKHLDEIGLECNQAHAPFTLKYDCNDEEERFLNITHSIESAAILGAKNIIVHSIAVPKGVDFKEYNIEYYRKFIPYCEKFGINVAVENLFNVDEKRHCFIGRAGTAKELTELVEAIDSPYITACVDIGHASVTGNEPEDFITDMSSDILKALHVQDTDYLSDTHTLPHLGQLNWDKIMKALKKIGYEGDLTFEILSYIGRFPNELIPEALKLAVSVGRRLISIYDNA